MEYKIRKGRVTAEQAADIVAMNSRGYSVTEIMHYTGLNQHRVLSFFADNGITDRKLARHRWTDAEKALMAKMYNEGRTLNDMVKVLPHSRASIWGNASKLRKAGIITRRLDHKK